MGLMTRVGDSAVGVVALVGGGVGDTRVGDSVVGGVAGVGGGVGDPRVGDGAVGVEADIGGGVVGSVGGSARGVQHW